jgi:hypothetical protein
MIQSRREYTHLDETPIMLAHKRIVQVTLDITCYDDLDLDDMDWHELLQLEPGEDVHCSVREFDPFK